MTSTKKNKATELSLSGSSPATVSATASSVAGTIDVALVEDNPGLCRSLMRLLRHAPDMRGLGAWPEGKSALREIPALQPDVILMDINLPGMSGIECTAHFKQLCPRAQIIMVTVYEDAENVFRALQAGACGYLLKRAGPEKILEAIRLARDGGSPMTSQVARKVVDFFQKIPAPAGPKVELTTREREVLELFAKGFVGKEVADQLKISYQTVKGYTKTIYEKLHVHSRSEALMKFVSDQRLSLNLPPTPAGPHPED